MFVCLFFVCFLMCPCLCVVQEGSLSAMDILHISNFINYFGKITNIEEIEVSPLLLKKGNTCLALYGLGSCRDERLHRMFRKGKVKFLRPSEGQKDWFNILVLHQNRLEYDRVGVEREVRERDGMRGEKKGVSLN